MREEAVGEAVLALVGQRVGVERAAKQADAQDVVPGAVAVLAVVEKGNTVARLGEVGETVRADLETRLVPRRVAVGGALHDAVHGLEGRLMETDAHREQRPQEHLPLMPPHTRLEVKASRAGEQGVSLRDPGPAKTPLDAHRRAQWPPLHHLYAFGSGDLLSFSLVACFYVPGVPVRWLVRVGEELVALAFQDFSFRHLVVDAVQAAVGADLNPQKLVLDG